MCQLTVSPLQIYHDLSVTCQNKHSYLIWSTFIPLCFGTVISGTAKCNFIGLMESVIVDTNIKTISASEVAIIVRPFMDQHNFW